MKIKIRDIAYYLPETYATNESLNEKHPSWDMSLVEQRSGVVKRHFADEGETSLDLAVRACEKLFEKHPHLREEVDGLIFCTQSGDHIMPPNSCILHKKLDLSENVLAYDFNLACSGYIYGLAMAKGFIQSGMARNILLVNADTYSKFIHEQDRSATVLFGDGAAVSWITASDDGTGIGDIQCCTSGANYDKFIIQAGGHRMPKTEETAAEITDKSGNVRTLEHIHMDGYGILVFVNSKIPKHIRGMLKRNDLKREDIDLYILHQASKMALDSLTRLLKVEPEQVFRNLREIGNTVSASIPIAIKDAMDSGRLVPGNKALLCGFGVGLSWGSAIMDV